MIVKNMRRQILIRDKAQKNTMSASEDEIAARIAGEIVISTSPGSTMRRWREKFRVSQLKLAKEIGLSPSTISDYESGRRASPGAGFVRKYVKNLVHLSWPKHDLKLEDLASPKDKPIISIGEFSRPVKVREIVSALKADVVVGEDLLELPLYGYTVVDSIGAIYALSGFDFYRIFGATSERVLIFTKVGLGRSPLVAVRVSQLKPRMVLLHGPKIVDPLAVELAKRDRLVFAISALARVEDFPIILGQLGAIEST